jgi:hypothetical protein
MNQITHNEARRRVRVLILKSLKSLSTKLKLDLKQQANKDGHLMSADPNPFLFRKDFNCKIE